MIYSTTIKCPNCGKEFNTEAEFDIIHHVVNGKERFDGKRVSKVKCPYCGVEV